MRAAAEIQGAAVVERLGAPAGEVLAELQPKEVAGESDAGDPATGRWCRVHGRERALVPARRSMDCNRARVPWVAPLPDHRRDPARVGELQAGWRSHRAAWQRDRLDKRPSRRARGCLVLIALLAFSCR